MRPVGGGAANQISCSYGVTTPVLEQTRLFPYRAAYETFLVKINVNNELANRYNRTY